MLTTAKEDTGVLIEQDSIMKRALRLEWLGQTVASISWGASVFVYGISSAGDWLQLIAASAWLVANLAALAPSEPNEQR